MAYALENELESRRLEDQSKLPAYSLESEIGAFKLEAGQRVLDAGCGTGLLCRYLSDRYLGFNGNSVQIEGCDASSLRLEQARRFSDSSQYRSIRYFQSVFPNSTIKEKSYDWIFCRYVFEHLEDHLPVVQDFFRIIKPAGSLVVVNFDGIITNLYPLSPRLNELMSVLKRELPLDLEIGRKIPSLMHQSGFESIEYRVEAVGFTGDALHAEQAQMKQRLTFALPLLSQIFKSDQSAEEFRDLYCRDMMSQGAVLFYNKFVVHGRRPF